MAVCKHPQFCYRGFGDPGNMKASALIRDPATLLLKAFFQLEVFYTLFQLSDLLLGVTCGLPGQNFPLVVQSSLKRTKKFCHTSEKNAWLDLVMDRNKLVSGHT